MRKVQFFAVLWTVALAIPFTALAVAGTAYLSENLTGITRALAQFGRETSVGGRGLVAELSARWPEIAGMVVGQIVILTFFLFARSSTAENAK